MHDCLTMGWSTKGEKGEGNAREEEGGMSIATCDARVKGKS